MGGQRMWVDQCSLHSKLDWNKFMNEYATTMTFTVSVFLISNTQDVLVL